MSMRVRAKLKSPENAAEENRYPAFWVAGISDELIIWSNTQDIEAAQRRDEALKRGVSQFQYGDSSIFANLFEHLRDHVDECEKFGEPAMKFVRQILKLTLESRNRSVISVGAMGAGSEFCENARTALDNGYSPQAVYMCVNPDVAYLSNVYRSCCLYDKMIHQGQELYPRLVSHDYFDSVRKKLDVMVLQIDMFQKQHPQDVRFLVLNRRNQTIYDSQTDAGKNILGLIHYEEQRPLGTDELILLHKQINTIDTNIRYRCENNIFYHKKRSTPCKPH